MDTEISQYVGELNDNSSGTEFVPDEEATDDSDTEELTKSNQKYLTKETDKFPIQTTGRQKRSEAWKHFTLESEINKIASCNICQKNISYNSSVSNLTKHLKRKHIITQNPESVAVNVENRKKCVPHKQMTLHKRFRSTVWKHYNMIDVATKTAYCKHCESRLSWACISNLRKHLQRRHAFVSDSEEEGEAEVLEEQTSPIWAYFKCLSREQKLAACLICKKRVDYSDLTDLSKHLNRKHSETLKEQVADIQKPRKLMIADNGNIYEIDENDTKVEPVTGTIQAIDDDSDQWLENNDEVDALETTEFLDEDIFDEPKSEPKKRRLIKNTEMRRNHEQRLKTNKRTQECDDTLDIFGKYMVSLLKKLPKHKSDRLQAEFVRQIMDAQQDSENNQNNDSIRIQNTCSKLNTPYNTRTSVGDTSVTENSEKIQHLVIGHEATNVGDKIAVRTVDSLK